MADVGENNYIINRFYKTDDGGNSWKQIIINAPPSSINGIHNLGGQGAYNLNIAVNPHDENIVYLCGMSIWKAVQDPIKNIWNISNVGEDIHPDNHAFVFDPSNPEVIYAGNDGGIYKSENGGATWDDTINQGLCITQFEFMEQHPNSDDIIFAGTQDNGMLRYQGNAEFYLSDDGDGGFVCIDPNHPDNIWHTYSRLTPIFSGQGGNRDSWKTLLGLWPIPELGIPSLFYPPLALDKTNSKNIAIGGTVLLLDSSAGQEGWPYRIVLPPRHDLLDNEIETISAINYIKSNLIYVGTNLGGIYRLTKDERWHVKAIHDMNFPKPYVWDVANVPGHENTIIVVMSGFGTTHIWKGIILDDGNVEWIDINPRTNNGVLIDIPFNAIVIDENKPDIMYAGADIGVLRTNDGGKNWTLFNQGLPNCQVYDMRLSRTGLLRIVMHGRGMWQRKIENDSGTFATTILD